MHMIKVQINFLLKNQLYVVLQLRNKCQSVSWTPGEPPAQPQTQQCQATQSMLQARNQIRKLQPSVPPAQPGKLKLSVAWKYPQPTAEDPKCANSSDKPNSPECSTSLVKNKKCATSSARQGKTECGIKRIRTPTSLDSMPTA